MELEDTWTCGVCDTTNTGDVFYGVCWKCQTSWATEPLAVDTTERCLACRATDGFHTLHCPDHPTPGIEPRTTPTKAPS